MKTGCWVAASLLLASCQPGANSQPEQVAAQPAAATAVMPVASPAPAGPATPYLGYHRYRGTVGSQAVTLELTISLPALTQAQAAHAQDFIMCEGRYHYDRHPAGLLLLSGTQPFRPGQPLLLTGADSARPQRPTGQ